MMSLDASVNMVVRAAKAAGIDILGHGRLGNSAVVLNSCYSGMLCAETAAMAVQRGLAKRGIMCQIRYHSACDIKPLCHKAMSSHKAEHDHHFTNVWDRVPANVQTRLQTKARSLRDAITQRLSSMRETGLRKEFIVSTRRQLVLNLGRKFVDYAYQILSETPWPADSACHCSKHDTKCCPVPMRSHTGDLLVEVGGSTCVGWSTMGRSWGWLDDAGGPCLVYLFWVRNYEPDFFVHECTSKFDYAVAHRILGDKMHLAAMQTSPVDWGIPVERRRQYLVAQSKKHRLDDSILRWTAWQIPAATNVCAATSTDELLWQRWLQSWGRVVDVDDPVDQQTCMLLPAGQHDQQQINPLCESHAFLLARGVAFEKHVARNQTWLPIVRMFYFCCAGPRVFFSTTLLDSESYSAEGWW